jgi:hypothetical protein
MQKWEYLEVLVQSGAADIVEAVNGQVYNVADKFWLVYCKKMGTIGWELAATRDMVRGGNTQGFIATFKRPIGNLEEEV